MQATSSFPRGDAGTQDSVTVHGLTAAAGFTPPANLMRGLLTLAAIGAVCFVVGLFVAPERAWAGYLIGFTYVAGLALAGALFLCLLTLSGARWATALRRIPEAMAGALPVVALLGLGLVLGLSSLYHWAHPTAVAEDPILAGKASYLNGLGFSLRLVLYFGLWLWLTRGMLAASRRQDEAGGLLTRGAGFRWAALFLPVFAITFSLASVDWLMSLEPHWFSTIYGLVTLSGLATSGLAVCILLAVHLRHGPLRGVIRAEHLDDLGKLGIALSLFWAYIWYCQYMLIWYTNLPEETTYYVIRNQGAWKILGTASLVVNWAIPFLALMPRAVRRSDRLMGRIAWLMLIGQALNLYLLVEPSRMSDGPQLGVFELGPLVGASGLFLWCTLRALSRAPLVPQRDPHLAESLGRASH